MTAVAVGTAICARVLDKSLFIHGLGAFVKGQLVPIDLHTATYVERALHLNPPAVEIVIGVPHPPADPSLTVPTSLSFHIGKREFVHKWAKDAVNKRVNELLREKPSTFFAEKSPIEIACDDVYAKKVAIVERERKKHEDAIDRLLAEIPKRAERLRQEAAERERQAQLAEEEAAKLDAVVANSEAAGEFHRLRTRFFGYSKVVNSFTVDVVKASTRPEAFFDEVKALHRRAAHALNAEDVERLRAALDELDAIYKGPAPSTVAGAVGVAPGFSNYMANE